MMELGPTARIWLTIRELGTDNGNQPNSNKFDPLSSNSNQQSIETRPSKENMVFFQQNSALLLNTVSTTRELSLHKKEYIFSKPRATAKCGSTPQQWMQVENLNGFPTKWLGWIFHHRNQIS
jgi:hypothetical protein